MKDDEGKMSSIKVSLKYVPVMMHLDPSESINNMGNLRVDVLDAQELPSADSNGKSDPYVKFELNGVDIFKTKVQKKTLNPAWNEYFEVPVTSRTAAKLIATVWDYDFADKPDRLGATFVNLEQLDPFKAQEIKLMLDGKSGMLRLRLLFRPDYVTRTRQGTSTFGTFAAPGKIVTGVAGAPLKGGAAVAGVVGHGVGKGASFLKRGFTGKKDKDLDPTPRTSTSDIPLITTEAADPAEDMGVKTTTGLSVPESGDVTPPSESSPSKGTNGSTPTHSRALSVSGASIHSAIGTGTASFTVVSSSGFPPSSDIYVVITQVRDGKTKTVGKTKHHKSPTGMVKFDETFRISCSPDVQFKIEAKEQHTFSSDDDLGETLYFVDESNSGQAKDLKVGNGTVTIKSSFTPSEGNSGTDSPKSALRRSFLSKRESRGPSRESTPGP
jgi:hypothetical protein